MGNLKVYSLVILVMLFWGVNVVAIKTVVANMNPLTMTAIRITLATILIFIITLFMKKVRKINGYEFKWLLLGSVLGVYIHHILLATGIANTTATNSSIIVGFSPLLTMFFVLIFGFGKFDFVQFLGFLMGLFGIIIAVTKGFNITTHLNSGDIIVFLSIASQCLSFLVIRKLSINMDSMLITTYLLIFGSVLLIPTSLIFDFKSWTTLSTVPTSNYITIFFSALLATAIGQTLYNYSISKIGPTETAIFTNFNIIFALLASALLLHENIEFVQILGCLLIIFGVLIGTGAIQDIIRKRRKNYV